MSLGLYVAQKRLKFKNKICHIGIMVVKFGQFSTIPEFFQDKTTKGVRATHSEGLCMAVYPPTPSFYAHVEG